MGTVLSVLHAKVGEQRAGMTRVRAVRGACAEGAPYATLELSDELGCSLTAWLRGSTLSWADVLRPGDEVWLRCNVAAIWPGGARDLDVLEIRRGESAVDEDEEIWDYEEVAHVGLSCELGGYVLRLVARDLAATTEDPASPAMQHARAMAMFLHDALPPAFRTAVPAPRPHRRRSRVA